MHGQKLLLKLCTVKPPAVCFDQTSISEIVEHKKNGYIVKEKDPKALKDGIIWLLNEIKENDLINFSSKRKN